ncbi:2-hydroxyacid dehydrogenase [Pigmentiphaga soli]|uniref:2-hydroxyacid dehydrogenase n=1 Tax=Pigmentiphaga soli TaxID=1007095 RepID=A0ABP8GJQ6_9BURK
MLLVLVYITPEHRELVSRSFELIYAPNDGLGADRSNGAAQIVEHGQRIRVVLTNGVNGLTREEIDSMPNLEIICTLGVGFENVAVDHATRRGIRVANAANTNDDCVADHAMAILLSAIRRVPTLNRLVREGVWRDDIPRPPQVSGRRLGILGLGAIGRKIARRAAGFDLQIAYTNRRRRDDVDYRFFDDVRALAAWSDFLVVAAPGGKETYHLVNAEVLRELGPQGVVVNIARGSVVDTGAVAAALRDGTLFAAALDVYEGEPTPPAPLLELDNALLTPHVGGISPEAIQASVQRFIDNATRHFAGLPLLSPVN